MGPNHVFKIKLRWSAYFGMTNKVTRILICLFETKAINQSESARKSAIAETAREFGFTKFPVIEMQISTSPAETHLA